VLVIFTASTRGGIFLTLTICELNLRWQASVEIFMALAPLPVIVLGVKVTDFTSVGWKISAL
jgi:hypothetical protein